MKMALLPQNWYDFFLLLLNNDASPVTNQLVSGAKRVELTGQHFIKFELLSGK